MREIPLTRALVALVDDEDYERLVDMGAWHARPADGHTWYAARSNWNHKIHMHRVIINAPPGIMVDHKDGNGLNNQKVNLRLVIGSQNHMNKRIQSNNTSGYKGVWFNKIKNKFVVQIRVDGKTRFGGHFISAEDAARAYDNLATQHFGEFARLNFPTEHKKENDE